MFHSITRASGAYESCFAWRWFLPESIVVSVSICEIANTVSQETFHGFQQIRCGGADNHHYWGGNEEEPNLARNERGHCSHIWFKLKLRFSSTVHEGGFYWRYNSVPLIRRLSVTAYTTCLFVTHIWAFWCAYICAFVRKWSYTWE